MGEYEQKRGERRGKRDREREYSSKSELHGIQKNGFDIIVLA
jgi:hypothetical protein